MEIQIYYQKWDEKSKASHELLEHVIRIYAKAHQIKLPETLQIHQEKTKSRFWNMYQISAFLFPTVENGGAVQLHRRKLVWIFRKNMTARQNVWQNDFSSDGSRVAGTARI